MARIEFVLNRDRVRVDDRPLAPALAVLRDRFGLTGAKEGCAEGDCGACTIALGAPAEGGVRYRAVNSCLLPAARLAGRHVVTVEGLAEPGNLHPVQRALLDSGAVQCGFCTPGMVMSLFALFAGNPAPTDEDAAGALEGNLCRCTGYESIRAAVRALRASGPAGFLPGYFAAVAGLLPGLPAAGWPDEGYHAPAAVSELPALLGRAPGCRFIAGGTDLMLEPAAASPVIDVSGVAELRSVLLDSGRLAIGAAATLADVLCSTDVRTRLPVLAEAAGQMASTQIRNLATVAGNIANASPVADAAVLLLALGAELELLSSAGPRRLPLERFYSGYKQTALAPGEFIARVFVPAGAARASFCKTGKRSSVDIASVNSALAVRVDGGAVAEIRFALGGVAPFPVLSTAAEALRGRALSGAAVLAAAEAAAAEARPISDVRGRAAFRRDLVRNQFILHFRRLFPQLTLTGLPGADPTP